MAISKEELEEVWNIRDKLLEARSRFLEEALKSNMHPKYSQYRRDAANELDDAIKSLSSWAWFALSARNFQ